MDIPTVKTISFRDFALKQGDTLVTIGFEIASGDSAEIIPLGSPEVFPISGPSGEIEIPIGSNNKYNVRTPDMETVVTLRCISAR